MKYAVLTYIIGNNQEKLREPLIIDKDVEYICITNLKNLSSKNWKIVFDDVQANCQRDKVSYIKFNPFKYTQAEKILILDGSHEIKTSLLPLFNELDNYDIMLKQHPASKSVEEELLKWKKQRNLSDISFGKIINAAKVSNTLLNQIPVYECCAMLIKNNDFTKHIFYANLDLMKIFGIENKLIITQQCTFSYLLYTFFKNLKIGHIKTGTYFNRFHHCSNVINPWN